MSFTRSLSALICATTLSVLGLSLSTANAAATPIPLDGYTPYWVTLSTSQTSWIAHNSIGSLLATLPTIPRLIYTQELGIGLQQAATRASASGGCLELGLYTANDGAAAINFLGELPAPQCTL
ncbi:MAG: hypothetical protein ACRCSF_10855 [Mycobacteriaceae bacterium]